MLMITAALDNKNAGEVALALVVSPFVQSIVQMVVPPVVATQMAAFEVLMHNILRSLPVSPPHAALLPANSPSPPPILPRCP